MSRGRLNAVRAMAAVAWSDGSLDDREKEALRRLGVKMGLDPAEQEQVEGCLVAPISLDGITFEELGEAEKQAVFLLACHYAYLDNLLWSGERKALQELARLLDISPQTRVLLESQVRARSKR